MHTHTLFIRVEIEIVLVFDFFNATAGQSGSCSTYRTRLKRTKSHKYALASAASHVPQNTDRKIHIPALTGQDDRPAQRILI